VTEDDLGNFFSGYENVYAIDERASLGIRPSGFGGQGLH
jgi:hypothetical protein